MRILLVDDHALFRDGVQSLLEAWGHEVVGQAADAERAVELARDLQPELILMDVRMPRGSGITATAAIHASHPAVRIVMLTVSEDEDDLFAAIRAGAHGYLLKNLEGRQLRAMIDAAGRGEAAITPATAARIIEEFNRRASHGAGHEPSVDQLTARELDVLRLVTAGCRNKEIATRLEITENTVKFHLRHILEKLHAASRAEVAVRAVRDGLVVPSEIGSEH